MSENQVSHDLKSVADGLDEELSALDTSFDPAKRLADLEYAKKRITPLVPAVVEALENFRVLELLRVAGQTADGDLGRAGLGRALRKAQEQLDSGSLDPDRCDELCRLLSGFAQSSKIELLQAWQSFVDGQFDARETAFMKVLCRQLLKADGARKEELDAAKKGLESAERIESERSAAPVLDRAKLRTKVIQVSGIARNLQIVRDTLIGSDPDVKNFVRSVGQEGGVALDEIPDSVWEWISAKGLSAAYVVTTAPGRSTRR